jgi:hypothetical protein
MHGYSKPRSTEGRGFFRPLKSACRLDLLCLLQSSAQKPSRERLQHDSDKKGQDQISGDRKAKAQSSISVLTPMPNLGPYAH